MWRARAPWPSWMPPWNRGSARLIPFFHWSARSPRRVPEESPGRGGRPFLEKEVPMVFRTITQLGRESTDRLPAVFRDRKRRKQAAHLHVECLEERCLLSTDPV